MIDKSLGIRGFDVTRDDFEKFYTKNVRNASIIDIYKTTNYFYNAEYFFKMLNQVCNGIRHNMKSLSEFANDPALQKQYQNIICQRQFIITKEQSDNMTLLMHSINQIIRDANAGNISRTETNLEVLSKLSERMVNSIERVKGTK